MTTPWILNPHWKHVFKSLFQKLLKHWKCKRKRDSLKFSSGSYIGKKFIEITSLHRAATRSVCFHGFASATSNNQIWFKTSRPEYVEYITCTHAGRLENASGSISHQSVARSKYHCILSRTSKAQVAVDLLHVGSWPLVHASMCKKTWEGIWNSGGQILVDKYPSEVTSQETSAQSYLFTKLLESPLDISCPFSAAIDKILHFLIFLVIFVLSENPQMIGKNNSLSLRARCICIKGAVFLLRCALSLASSSKLHQSYCHRRMLLKLCLEMTGNM